MLDFPKAYSDFVTYLDRQLSQFVESSQFIVDMMLTLCLCPHAFCNPYFPNSLYRASGLTK